MNERLEHNEPLPPQFKKLSQWLDLLQTDQINIADGCCPESLIVFLGLSDVNFAVEVHLPCPKVPKGSLKLVCVEDAVDVEYEYSIEGDYTVITWLRIVSFVLGAALTCEDEMPGDDGSEMPVHSNN